MGDNKFTCKICSLSMKYTYFGNSPSFFQDVVYVDMCGVYMKMLVDVCFDGVIVKRTLTRLGDNQ